MTSYNSDPDEQYGCLIGFLITVALILLSVLTYVIWLGWGWWLLSGTLVCFMYYHVRRWMLNIPQYKMNDILKVLDRYTWKSVHEIRDELRRSKGVTSSYQDIIRWPDITWTECSLEALERIEFIELRSGSRVCETCGPTHLLNEYRLTTTGLRRKGKIIDTQRMHSGITGGRPVFESSTSL